MDIGKFWFWIVVSLKNVGQLIEILLFYSVCILKKEADNISFF